MARTVMVTLALFVAAGAVSHGQEALSERFYQAIRLNDLSSLGELAKRDPNVKDARGATPLMHAAILGTAEHLKLLLDAGADVNAKNTFDGTALICAAGDPGKSRLLIDHGADINARSQRGRTPLMLAASREGNAALVRLLLARGADVRGMDADGNSALLLAAGNGDREIMRLLIAKGADVNVPNTSLGLTPLGSAVSSNRSDAVRLLLANRARVDVPALNASSRVRNGQLALRDTSALMLAAPYAATAIIDHLLRAGAVVNARDERGMTALMLAVASETQDVKIVNRLLEAGADVNVRSASQETALDWALKFGAADVIATLENAGAKIGAAPLASVAPPPPAKDDATVALRRSIDLLQRSSTEYFKKSGCIGCHHQPMTAMAIGAARRIGVPIDEDAAAEQLRLMRGQAAVFQVRVLEGYGANGNRELPFVQGLRVSGYRPDAITDSLVASIVSIQQRDGSWRHVPAISRAPIEESDIYRTVEAVRALQTFGFPGLKVEIAQRIARARRWLLEATPRATDDYAMLLVGLTATAPGHPRIRALAKALIAQQRADGGWGGNRHLPSDAFATGEALYALRESGSVTPADPTHRRGLQYLLSTQYPDGSWHVRSRAPKFQPYFQSGFPFEHDQWISAAGTAWAAVSLAADLERQRTSTARR
jgi:ankyrin repeat protein